LQITRVELRNIKNHADAAWTFSPGVVAICGPNGAGKTTILEAIAWALFDHLDYNREDFVKRGAKRGSVAVGFISNLDEREYVVNRDTGGGYYIFDPDTKIRLVEQKNQVVPWLRQHIGVEPEADLSALFKSTIGVPQGTFTYDFTLAPTPRKKVFDQILKVEEYRQASDNLKDTLRHIEGRITELERKLAEAQGELKNYDETKRQHDETAGRLHSLEEEQRAANELRARAAGEVAQFDELELRVTELRGATERLRVKLDFTRGQLAGANEALKASQAAAAIVAAARAGYENFQRAAKALGEMESRREERDRLREQAAKVDRELVTVRLRAEQTGEKLAEIAQAKITVGELAARVSEQLAIETRLGRLREARGEAQGIERSLAALDRELERLRTRYSDLSRQIEAAGKLREQAERANALEDERTLLNQEIQQKEVSLNNYKVKREHLDNLRAELKRLDGELETNAREIARLEPVSAATAKLAESEARQQGETERLAKLRAEVARDAEMITALESGGVCPLLTEKCLNLKAGESLDSRFRTGLEKRRAEITRLEAATKTLVVKVKQLRADAAEAARLPKLREEEARLDNARAEQRRRIAKLEDEVAIGSTVSDGEIKQLKYKQLGIEALLRDAREAQQKYSQVEVLKCELTTVKNEGSARRGDREELKTRLDAIGNTETQLAEAQRALSALNDPRGRAAALEQLIAREGEVRREAESAERQAAEVAATLDQLRKQLQGHATLDAEVAEAGALRALSERDYHAFIANEKIAATVAACETEVAALAFDLGQAEESLNTAGTQLAQLEAEYDAGSHQRARGLLIEARDRATQLAAQIEHTREQFIQLQSLLESLDKVRERMRDELAAREKAVRLQETADFIRDILNKAAPYITETWLFSISHEANQLFREITGRYDVTLRWTKDYEVTLEEEGRERPFANLSGGEQMAAALAVRLALLRQLSEINIAFFDEPTTNMDEERRRNLAQQIGRIRSFQQLFVISHDDSFESFTDQVITLNAKEGG